MAATGVALQCRGTPRTMTLQQKETIHLTFGALPLHISTNFFNQQSSHFQYSAPDESEEASEPTLDADIDFQEGVGTRRGESTFFPREIVCAFKEELGTRWGAYDVVFEDDDDEEYRRDQLAPADGVYDEEVLRAANAPKEGLLAWSRPAEVLRTSERVRRAVYADEVDDEEADDTDDDYEYEQRVETKDTTPEPSTSAAVPVKRQAPRRRLPPFAYAHNPHHPRSIVTLPQMHGAAGALGPMGADRNQGFAPLDSFEAGWSLAREIERDSSAVDESLRFFAENSDLLQSFNLVSSSSDGFSGLAHATLEVLQDEYPKTPVVAWAAQWGEVDFEAVEEDAERARLSRLRRTNQILSLWSLSHASLFVPLHLPSSLSQGSDSSFTKHADWTDPRNAGALFAAHMDTATLLSRLRKGREPTSAMISRLNWRHDTPIASLSGCLPTPPLAPIVMESANKMDPIEALLASRGYDSKPSKRSPEHLSPQKRAERGAQQIRRYNANFSFKEQEGQSLSSTDFANHAVARDDDMLAQIPTKEALERYLSNGETIDEPLTKASFVPLRFNVRSAAFPQIFCGNVTSQGRMMASSEVKTRRVDKVSMATTLRTTPSTSNTLRPAKAFVDRTLIRGHAPLSAFGIGGTRGTAAGQAANDESEGLLGGRDGLMEIRERLEELLSAYEEEGATGHDAEEGMGTDEEYAQEAGDEDWDL